MSASIGVVAARQLGEPAQRAAQRVEAHRGGDEGRAGALGDHERAARDRRWCGRR